MLSAVGWASIHKLYTWSKDNLAEIAKGWIIKADPKPAPAPAPNTQVPPGSLKPLPLPQLPPPAPVPTHTFVPGSGIQPATGKLSSFETAGTAAVSSQQQVVLIQGTRTATASGTIAKGKVMVRLTDVAGFLGTGVQ